MERPLKATISARGGAVVIFGGRAYFRVLRPSFFLSYSWPGRSLCERAGRIGSAGIRYIAVIPWSWQRVPFLRLAHEAADKCTLAPRYTADHGANLIIVWHTIRKRPSDYLDRRTEVIWTEVAGLIRVQ
jgi:hypothetical protein